MIIERRRSIGGFCSDRWFTITFNGVTQVPEGYLWSYTIVNDGSEQDLSDWVLELTNCAGVGQSLPCSLGICEWVTQDCPDADRTECSSFFGIKFDNLPPGQLAQTFTFTLPFAAGQTEGCIYLKYGLNRVCVRITVPDCEDSPCPPCPEDSLRDGKVFRVPVTLPSSACELSWIAEAPDFYLCVNGIERNSGVCDQLTELTVCEDTESEQTLRCFVPLDYVQLRGTLQIFWQLRCELETICSLQPIALDVLAVTEVAVDEICYYCVGESPSIELQDLCALLSVEWLGLSEDGELSYRVTFLGCPKVQ